LDDLLEIAAQIPNRGIDLRESDSHLD
jgi:hypothetical protein